jgi:hypothetical protein
MEELMPPKGATWRGVKSIIIEPLSVKLISDKVCDMLAPKKVEILKSKVGRIEHEGLKTTVELESPLTCRMEEEDKLICK